MRFWLGAFQRWAKAHVSLPPYETFFVEPFYQLMRLTLLAQKMESAGEMGADIVSVVHVSPKANENLATNLEAAPILKQYGATLYDAWRRIAPPGRFTPISRESFLNAVEQVAHPALQDWAAYLLKRYGWWRQ